MKKDQIVKFHTPLKDEDPLQVYVLLEVFEDAVPPRAKIMALNTGLHFPPINTVSPSDLEVVEGATKELRDYLSVIRSNLS